MQPIRTIEAQCTHAEFMQSLPAAVGQKPYEITDNRVIVYDKKKCIEIIVSDLPVRELGSLELPMEKIQFTFPEHTEEEAEDFMTNYRKHAFRCGGG